MSLREPLKGKLIRAILDNDHMSQETVLALVEDEILNAYHEGYANGRKDYDLVTK